MFASTAYATILRTKKVLGDLKIKNHDEQPIHTVANFLNKEEIEAFQNKFVIETSTPVYGYGKVDVPTSFVERIKLVLGEIDATSSNGEEGMSHLFHGKYKKRFKYAPFISFVYLFACFLT